MTDHYDIHKARVTAFSEEFLRQQIRDGISDGQQRVLLAAISMVSETETIEELRALVAYSLKPDFHSSLGGADPETNKRVARFVQLIASSVELPYDQSPQRRAQAAAFQTVAGLQQAAAQATTTSLLSRFRSGKPHPE